MCVVCVAVVQALQQHTASVGEGGVGLLGGGELLLQSALLPDLLRLQRRLLVDVSVEFGEVHRDVVVRQLAAQAEVLLASALHHVALQALAVQRQTRELGALLGDHRAVAAQLPLLRLQLLHQ